MKKKILSKKEKLEFYGFYTFHTYILPYTILIGLIFSFIGKFIGSSVNINSAEGLFVTGLIGIGLLIFANYRKNKFKKELLEE
jgi:ABC-type multidrug transport system permease subunit